MKKFKLLGYCSIVFITMLIFSCSDDDSQDIPILPSPTQDQSSDISIPNDDKESINLNNKDNEEKFSPIPNLGSNQQDDSQDNETNLIESENQDAIENIEVVEEYGKVSNDTNENKKQINKNEKDSLYIVKKPLNIDDKIKTVVSNGKAFVALKNDGSVVSWGDKRFGGDSSQVQKDLKKVKKIYYNDIAFAALTQDGSVIVWGANNPGEENFIYHPNNSFIKTIIWGISGLPSRVTEIYSTNKTFAIFKSDGSVVSWGKGAKYSSKIQNLIKKEGGAKLSVSNGDSIATLTLQGSVITWGPYNSLLLIPEQLRSNVKDITFDGKTFTATKVDGSTITWN